MVIIVINELGERKTSKTSNNNGRKQRSMTGREKLFKTKAEDKTELVEKREKVIFLYPTSGEK